MKMLSKLEKSSGCWFLIAISVIFFFLRFPSLFEPNWYGDEGIYQTLGHAMNSGRLLYEGIFDNKPPLLYFFYSLVSSDLFAIRFLSLVFGLLAIFAFYFLSKRLLNNQRAVFVATFFFAFLFGIPLIEGNIANSENFMLFPNILSALLLLKSLEEDKPKKFRILFFSGLVLGISLLLKIVAIFDFAAFFLFLLLVNLPSQFLRILNKNVLWENVKALAIFSLGFFTPILLTSFYFFFSGAFSLYLKAVLLNMVGYVGYGNKFIIPQGLLALKLVLLAAFSLFVFLKKQTFGREFAFIYLWFGFSMFNAYFSQRPYTHYLLVLLPSFCLLLGLFYINRKISKLSGVLVFSTLILVLLSFWFYTKTFSYYQNFFSFITGNKSVYAYQRFFDRNTPRDYELASYINLNTKDIDGVFVWGNNAQIYGLTKKLPPGRYTVAYHITNYNDGKENTWEGIEKNKPKLIIIMPNQPPFPFPLIKYHQKINLEGIQIYERLYN